MNLNRRDAVCVQFERQVGEKHSLDVNCLEPKKSDPVRQAMPAESTRKFLVSALAAVLLILVMAIAKTVVAYTWVKNAEQERSAAASPSQSTLPEGAAEQLAAFLSSADAVDALDRLSRAIPASTGIQDVTIEAAEITFRGTAPRAMAVYEGLIAEGFKDVRLHQDVVPADGSDLELFAISADNPFAPVAESQ